MYVSPVKVLAPKTKPFYRTRAEIKPKARAPVLLPLNTEHVNGRANNSAKDPESRSFALIEFEALLHDVWDEARLHLAA